MPVERSAGALVYRNTGHGRNYLLLQYGWGHWDFPKGHVEEGETDLEAVRREIREETGIGRYRLIDGFQETIKYFYIHRSKRVFKTVVFYLAETRAKAVRLSREHIHFVWLPIDEAIERATFNNSKNLLRKAERRLIRSTRS